MKARYLSLEPLIDWQHMTRPIHWEEVFTSKNPLVVEIGMGNGEYLVRRAEIQKAYNFIGIDREWPSVWRALREISKKALPNVRVIKSDAQFALYRLFQAETLEEIYSLFPCPWPKKHHEKHRLFKKDFLQRINTCLKPGKTFTVVTDDENYFHWILNEGINTGFNISREIISAGFSTKYENKWLKEGKSCFYKMVFTKSKHMDITTHRDIPMKIYKVDHFNPTSFYPKPLRENIVVEFKDFLYDESKQRALIRVFVVEDYFTQDLWIEVTRNEAEWIIKPSQGCGWVPTRGLQKALDRIYQTCKGY